MGNSRIVFAVALLLLCVGCSSSSTNEIPIGPAISIAAPLGLPPVPSPKDNPPTAAGVALGRRLFYDKRLSIDNSISCASCHDPQRAFIDGRRFAVGVGGKIGVRNVPTVLNAAYDASQFWDGRAATLEDQAGFPIANPIEMNEPHDVAVSKLQSDAAYRAEFERVYGPGRLTISKVEKALASFERTVISGNSPFDRYLYAGDKQALSPAAIRGYEVFADPSRGNCVACHAIGKTYAVFTDGKFHNIGAGVTGEGELTDLGRYQVTKVETDKGAFKTVSLRNAAETAPYMHDGSLKTLKDVVDFYAGNGNSNPYLDKEIKKIRLNGHERADLIEFLKSLSGQMPPNVGPPQ